MRALNRPMFNMGGPIKQGIMHGIREPYKGGGAATGLVGHPAYPRTGGREHHAAFVIPAVWATVARMLAGQGIKKVAQKGIGSAAQGELFKKGIQESVKKAAGSAGSAGGAGITAAAPTGFKGWLMRDPMIASALWAKRALMSPTSKGFGKSALRFATAPSSLATIGYFGGKKLLGGDEEVDKVVTGIEKPGGFPSAVVKEKAVLSEAQKKAFAKSQREKRVNKYLDLMGYDRSKKLAIADALIDASKIVGERGTLDPKNITQELISPVIQATSKRLDKPQQIREAVGLMATKAEIEKDLSKETDALKTELTELQIEGAKETLKASRSFEGGLSKFISDRKGKVDKVTLERISRLLADQHKETFVKTEEGTVPTGDGIYMIGDGIFRVTDGVPKQIA